VLKVGLVRIGHYPNCLLTATIKIGFVFFKPNFPDWLLNVTRCVTDNGNRDYWLKGRRIFSESQRSRYGTSLVYKRFTKGKRCFVCVFENKIIKLSTIYYF